MWIRKEKLAKMLNHEYTRGWNHGHISYRPPQDYSQWALSLDKGEDGFYKPFKEVESGWTDSRTPVPDSIKSVFGDYL